MTIDLINKKLAAEFIFGNTAEWWISKVASFPHNEWILPTGAAMDGTDDYKFFDDLFYFNLCEKMITPVWHNGSFKGRVVKFKISVD